MFGKALVIGLAAALLAGCGFHLRGQADLPPAMAVTYIRSEDPQSLMARTLARNLEANGVRVTENAKAATATISILRDEMLRRTLAAGPTGEAREYELRQLVDYAVTLEDGTPLVPRNTISATRDALYNETEVLGRAEGEAILFQDMATDLSQTILRRLQRSG